MTYPDALLAVGLSSVAAGLASYIVHRRISYDIRRHHQEVGGAVFLQLGVIYAVLLAFVFSETWGEYNTAAEAINAECADLQGGAVLSHGLPQQAGEAVRRATALYLTTVINKEWPLMARRRESPDAATMMQTLIRDAAALPATGASDSGIRNQIVTLELAAQAEREIRLFQMDQGIPLILWLLILVYSAVLAGFVILSGVEYASSLIVFSSLFCGLTLLILVIIRMLDYPFEGALALLPTEFQQTLTRMDLLIGTR